MKGDFEKFFVSPPPEANHHLRIKGEQKFSNLFIQREKRFFLNSHYSSNNIWIPCSHSSRAMTSAFKSMCFPSNQVKFTKHWKTGCLVVLISMKGFNQSCSSAILPYLLFLLKLLSKHILINIFLYLSHSTCQLLEWNDHKRFLLPTQMSLFKQPFISIVFSIPLYTFVE